jgi:hypothetical protein
VWVVLCVVEGVERVNSVVARAWAGGGDAVSGNVGFSDSFFELVSPFAVTQEPSCTNTFPNRGLVDCGQELCACARFPHLAQIASISTEATRAILRDAVPEPRVMLSVALKHPYLNSNMHHTSNSTRISVQVSSLQKASSGLSRGIVQHHAFYTRMSEGRRPAAITHAPSSPYTLFICSFGVAGMSMVVVSC